MSREFKAKVKRVALTVLDHREPVWMPSEGIPSSRAECPDTSRKMCPFVKCREHLLRLDGGSDGDGYRAGRPGLSRVTRAARGRTLSETGHAGDERAPTTLEPHWIGPDGEFRFVETCTLNAIKRHGGAMSNDQVGALMHRHRTLIGKLTYKLVAKLRTEHNITADDIVRLCEPDRRVDVEPSRAKPR
jgi:hypothetical protein